MYMTPGATTPVQSGSSVQEFERSRFDALEYDHLEKLEAERRGRNLGRLCSTERLLAQHGHGGLADLLRAMRIDCQDRGEDLGSDSSIRALLWSLKTGPGHATYAAKIGTIYTSVSDMVSQQAWSRFFRCWDVWSSVVSVLDHRLVSIGISRRPDVDVVAYKAALDLIRDRVVARIRPYANWYSWQLDVSIAEGNRHPHYHLLCIVPSEVAAAFYDDVGDLKLEIFREEGLIHLTHCDWPDGDRRHKIFELADRQKAWVMALAYFSRVFEYRDMPTWSRMPTLSCPVDIDDPVVNMHRRWEEALAGILKVSSERKTIGGRRIALLLQDDTRRRVVTFRQSKAWRTVPDRLASIRRKQECKSEPALSDHLLSPATPVRTAPPNATCNAAADDDRATAELGSPYEHGSIALEPELVRNPYRGDGANDGSSPTRVVNKGIKQPRVGRPRKDLSQHAVLLALIEEGSTLAAAKALGTSPRLIRKVLADAGVASYPVGRPRIVGRPQ